MADVVTFTNPVRNYDGSGGASASVPVTFVGIEQEFGSISAYTFHIESSVASLYGLDSSSSNPCQLNSTFAYTIDGQPFGFGFVVAKPKKKTFEEGEFLEVVCWGLEGALAKAACPNTLLSPNNPFFWTLATDAVATTALPLQKTSAYGSFQGDTLWPDPADATGAKTYLADASSANDTLDAELLDSETAPFYIELSTSNRGFQARGWLKIESEWLYYDGYDDTGSGGKYRCRVTARAQLGTSAATHAAASTVYNKVSKGMAPGTCELLRDAVRLRREKEFRPVPQLGCFALGGGGGSNVYTTNASWYDTDQSLDAGSAVVTVEEIVGYLCGGDGEFGGANFLGGQMDFDALGLGITRYDYDPASKAQYAWQAIQDLIQAVGLENEVQFWFDHRTGNLRLAIVAEDTPVLTLAHVQSIETEQTIEDVYSAVLVGHTDDQPVNRAHPDFAYHVGCSASGAQPDTWHRTTAGGGSFDYGTETTSTSGTGGSFGVDVLINGDPAAKLTAEFEHDPGGQFPFCDFYFDSTASTVLKLSRFAVRIGNYRAIEGWSRTTANAEFTYQVKLQGCVDYDTATNSGTWQDLGCEIEGKPDPNGVPELVEFTDFLLPAVNAVRIVFLYMAGPKQAGDFYRASVHDVIIEGNNERYTLVQTSDTEQAQSGFVYAVSTHKKLRGGPNSNVGGGAARVDILPNIGPASDTAARTIGRQYLIGKLNQSTVKTYTYDGVISSSTLPGIGDTITVTPDSFTGIIRGLSMQKTYEGRVWTFRCVDPDAGVIT